MSVASRAENTPTRRGAGITRRTLLGAAVAGGVGVATIRLLRLNHAHVPVATPGRSDWNSPLASEPARVAQLLRRTSFGASPDDLEKSQSAGFAKTVERLLETPPVQPPDVAAAHGPDRQFQPQALQQWWLDHMLQTPTPFAERMTLFWHNHFTSDYRKTANNVFMLWQNLTWRNFALKDLRSFLLQVTVDPAMLKYLDLAQSTGQSPNENYSRELMELFSMGAGTFSEDDVRNGAKALAGWTLPKPTSRVDVVVDKKANVTQKQDVYEKPATGVFDPKRAYQGPVAFLGKTGKFDVEAVVDRILAQPVTAPFIVNKVLTHFVTPQPSAAYVKRLADRFRASKYDMKGLMRDVLTSPEFSSAQAYRSLVKSPLEFTINCLVAIRQPQQSKLVLGALQGMGQMPFDPPDVGGWPNNDAWVSSNTWMSRVNFATQLVTAKGGLPSASDAHKQHLDGVLSPGTVKLLNQATDDKNRWFVVLASPEFQLK
jgi:uncharacterized protein (DUF1800 family)